MPTGYTAELMDKGQDFRTFVLGCARAFGACVMQRDDPMKQPPAKQEPSDYHTKAIKEAQERLAALKAMTAEEQITEGLALRERAVASARESLANAQVQNKRLDDMTAQVRAWEPPTEEHKGLKDFMLDQIRISRNTGWAEEWLAKAEEKTPEAYFVEAVSSAVRSVAYHTTEHEKELERTNGRNEWIDRLYESLPSSH